jgi:hypothetical protein
MRLVVDDLLRGARYGGGTSYQEQGMESIRWPDPWDRWERDGSGEPPPAGGRDGGRNDVIRCSPVVSDGLALPKADAVIVRDAET